MPRTTMTLDEDVAEALRNLAHERRQPLKRVVNETLRRGLAPMREAPAGPYTIVRDMGAPRMDLTKALQIAFDLEDEETIRKMALGR
ncbi:MAG: antitoxin [Solirubrobacteraceae bacterium]